MMGLKEDSQENGYEQNGFDLHNDPVLPNATPIEALDDDSEERAHQRKLALCHAIVKRIQQMGCVDSLCQEWIELI